MKSRYDESNIWRPNGALGAKNHDIYYVTREAVPKLKSPTGTTYGTKLMTHYYVTLGVHTSTVLSQEVTKLSLLIERGYI